jgi:hypothetical protein
VLFNVLEVDRTELLLLDLFEPLVLFCECRQHHLSVILFCIMIFQRGPIEHLRQPTLTPMNLLYIGLLNGFVPVHPDFRQLLEPEPGPLPPLTHLPILLLLLKLLIPQLSLLPQQFELGGPIPPSSLDVVMLASQLLDYLPVLLGVQQAGLLGLGLLGAQQDLAQLQRVLKLSQLVR